jgi:putative MATE family efflux protein
MTSNTKNPEIPAHYANKGDLTHGAIHKHLIRLTIPMIWGIAAVIFAQLTDTYFVAQLGTTELAAISFTFPVTMILSHFVFGINIAMSSTIARLLGAKDNDTARRVTLHGVAMALIASTIVCGATFLGLKPLFTMLGADETIMPFIMEYMPLWLLASIILSVPVNGNSALRASGDALWPAIIMTFSAVMNMILDPIFIFGLFGAPVMGVKGAAFATLLAYISCACLGLYIMIVKKKILSFEKLHLDQFKDSFKRLIVIAAPAGITNIIGPLTHAVLTAILATYGTQAIAAYGITSRLESLAMLAVMSLGLAMAPIVGQNFGAKNYARVNQTIQQAITFNFIWSFSAALIFGLFARQISGLFTQDPAVIEIASLYFWLVPFSFAFGNLIFGWSSAFNAMGMPMRSFTMITVKSLAMTIPALFIGSWLGGVKGIFISIAAVNVIGGLFFHMLSLRACKRYNSEMA